MGRTPAQTFSQQLYQFQVCACALDWFRAAQAASLRLSLRLPVTECFPASTSLSCLSGPGGFFRVFQGLLVGLRLLKYWHVRN